MFVSIEMTGQAVEFEQKFNYRRPMYLILDYIWEMELHQQALQVVFVFLCVWVCMCVCVCLYSVCVCVCVYVCVCVFV